MKIAYLFQNIGTIFSDPRAEQIHILYSIRGLQERGHHVELLALYRDRRVIHSDDIQAIKCDELGRTHYGNLGVTGTSIFKYIESGIRRVQTELNLPYLALFDSLRMYDACVRNLAGYTLIHERYNLLSVAGALASRRLGVPYVLQVEADLMEQRTMKGQHERGLRRLIGIGGSKFCFKTARKITCGSSVLRAHLIQKWGLDPMRIEVLPCAADLTAFDREFDGEVVKRELGLFNEPIIIWVGGFHVWQDLDLLVESFSRVKKVIPNVKLVLVGDGQKRPRVQRKVRDNDLEDAVLFVGSLAHERIPELLSIADVAINPCPPFYSYTGTPLKIFEYMAAGKAIVTTNIDEISSVVKDNYSGLLVEPGDVDGFATAITKLLNDPVLRGRLAQNARKEALRSHSWDHYAERLEGIYLSVL